MSAPISDVMWLVARLRNEQGRTSVRPVSHRPGSGRHMAGSS